MNSIGESHVSLLIIPGYGDQPTNAAKVQDANIGQMLQQHQLTTDRLASTIKLLHANYDRFSVNFRRIHQLCIMEGGAERTHRWIAPYSL